MSRPVKFSLFLIISPPLISVLISIFDILRAFEFANIAWPSIRLRIIGLSVILSKYELFGNSFNSQSF